jgi:protein-disulfide isomerase
MFALRCWLIALLLGLPMACAGRQLAPAQPLGALEPGADPAWGRSQAPVTIVELCDFQCPFCAQAQATLQQIRATYGPERVRIVFKHNPLPFHPLARPAHEAAATVFGLGGSTAFWKFHDRVFAHQESLDQQPFEQWAVEAGIDRQAFRRAYAAKRYAPKVDADVALAERIGARATPTFRVNGVAIVGAQPLAAFRRVIDRQLAEAKQPAPGSANDPEDTTVWQVPVLADDPVRGPPDALVTVVEWSDFQCPFCKQVEPILTALLRSYGPDLRLVWKDNPLEFHARALPAALLARAAFEERGNQGFWDVHDALFASAPDLQDSALAEIASRFGVSWPDVQAAAARDRMPVKLEQAVDQAEDLDGRGTPHFFINGVRLAGAQPIEIFRARIDTELEKARARVANGVSRSKLYGEIMREASPPPPPERKVVAPPGATSPARGPANAQVVIQEWADLECPFCRRAAATLAEVEREFGGSVRIVWRHLPLPMHGRAQVAAEAAEEVLAQKGQAAFWQYCDRLFEAQAVDRGLERPNLERLAVALGVDPVRFNTALDSGRHRARVAADAQAARDAGIEAAPAFVINGYFLVGARSPRSFRRTIRRALTETKQP